MNRLLRVGVAAIALTLVGAAAHAVDVINQDQETHQLQVTIDHKDTLLDVPAGQTLKGICDKCSLSLDGDESLDVAGDQVAMIKSGKLKIQ